MFNVNLNELNNLIYQNSSKVTLGHNNYVSFKLKIILCQNESIFNIKNLKINIGNKIPIITKGRRLKKTYNFRMKKLKLKVLLL